MHGDIITVIAVLSMVAVKMALKTCQYEYRVPLDIDIIHIQVQPVPYQMGINQLCDCMHLRIGHKLFGCP